MSDDSSHAPSNSRHWMLGAPDPIFEDKESAALFSAFCNDLEAKDLDTNKLGPVEDNDTSLAQPMNEAAPNTYPYPSPQSLSPTPFVQQQSGPIIIPQHVSVSEIPPTTSNSSPMHPPQTVPRQKSVFSNPTPTHPSQFVSQKMPGTPSTSSNPSPMHPPQTVPRQMPVYMRQGPSCSQLPFNICRTSCQETIQIIQQLLEFHHKCCPHHNLMFRAMPNGYTPDARASSQVNIHGTTYHQHQQVQWVSQPAPPVPGPSSSAPAIPGPSSSAPALPRAHLKPTQKVFEFAKLTVPANFVANPGNHARWRIEKDGKRTYLNLSKGKQAQYSEKAGKQLLDAAKSINPVNTKL